MFDEKRTVLGMEHSAALKSALTLGRLYRQHGRDAEASKLADAYSDISGVCLMPREGGGLECCDDVVETLDEHLDSIFGLVYDDSYHIGRSNFKRMRNS